MCQSLLEQGTESQVALDGQCAPCLASSPPSLCKWVNERQKLGNALSVKVEKRFNCSPFTIYILKAISHTHSWASSVTFVPSSMIQKQHFIDKSAINRSLSFS